MLKLLHRDFGERSQPSMHAFYGWCKESELIGLILLRPTALLA